MLGFLYEELYSVTESKSETHELIAKATADTPVKETTRQSNKKNGTMERFFSAAKKKLGGSSNSLKESRDFLGASESLHHSNSTRTRQTTVSSLQLDTATVNSTSPFERPENDEEIYSLYVQTMGKLGVDVEAVPALKNKGANDMWNMVCNAGLQLRDDRNTPEYFANTLMNESKNSHLNVTFLKSLRIELGSKPLSWNDDFARFGGWDAVIEALKKLKTVKQLEVKLPPLRELVKIFRAFSNNKQGLEFVFKDSGERALESISALICVLGVPCVQCRLGALETILMLALIEEFKMVPVIIEAFRREKMFSVFATVLTDTFNSIRSIKDHESYSFLLDSVLLINSLIAFGYERNDLEFRLKLRSEIISSDLKKAFNKYKALNDKALTVHCETYLHKAQADGDEFMAQFDKSEHDMKNPLSLMQTVVEVLEKDQLTLDAFMGFMTKMLLISSRSEGRMEFVAAIDALFDEAIALSSGNAIEMDKLTFKGKEEKAAFLQMKKKAEKMENDLLHANKRNENLTKIQAEMESQLEAKGQRIKALSVEKSQQQTEFEQKRRENEEELKRLRDECNELKKFQENYETTRMANLNLDSPTIEGNASTVISVLAPPPPPLPTSLGGIPPPPPLPTSLGGIPPPPPMFGAPPPPPPFPMMNFNGIPPPPPPPPMFGTPQPPHPNLFGAPAAAPTKPKPKPVGKTRQLQWEKLTQVEGTIWKEIESSKWETIIDYKELEAAFKYDPKVSKQSFPEERRISFSSSGSALMDPKKARNMQIILGRLKLSHHELRTSLLRMDETIWTESIVHEIIKYLPSKHELDEIAKFYEDPINLESTKVTAERMSFELSKIKGLEERLSSIELKALIGDWHVEAMEQLDSLLKALNELKERDSLKSFLGLVLATGNFLNTGTYKANASGFKIDSILKIRDMKTTEGNSNLLAYILEFLQRNRLEILSLPVDIKNTSLANKISLDSMTELVAEKRRTIERLEKMTESYKMANYEDLNGGFDRYLSLIEPFVLCAKENINIVQEKLACATREFAAILKFFGDDGDFKTPQDLLNVFSDFSADFERIKQELIASSNDDSDLKKKISGVLKSQTDNTRNLMENILGAARHIN